MNQRSSHFSLGNTSAPYGTIYTKDYVAKQSSKQQPNGSNPFRGSSLQANNHQKTSFQTTNKALMQNWGQIQQAKLDPKKLQNLRGHHFKLGNYNPASISTSHKIFYDRKHLNNQATNKQQESKTKMRMHNHDFKQQNWTNFQSSYTSQYKGLQGDVNKLAREKKQDHGGAIVLGNNIIPMQTTSAMDYTQKKLPVASTSNKPLLQQTSALVLGNTSSNQPMQTLNQYYFNVKPLQRNALPQATMKQLRSTHFNLGGTKQNYSTQSNLYQSYGNGNNASKFQVPTYESGTWVDKQAKFNAMTTNQRQLPTRQVQPYKKHEGKYKDGFELGTLKNSYETEFTTNFNDKGSNNRAANAKRQDNVVIGMDKGTYVSQQRANYKSRDLKEAQSDSSAIKAMNTEDHFKIGGNSNPAHLTTYQDQYRKDVENKNKMFHSQKI